MPKISTYVIDTSTGHPAANVPIRLERHFEGKWHAAGIAITGEDGRATPREIEPRDSESREIELGAGEVSQQTLRKGDYRLTFEVAAYFKSREIKAFFPFVQVTFTVGEIRDYHVPLLLGPFGYSTYLGR